MLLMLCVNDLKEMELFALLSLEMMLFTIGDLDNLDHNLSSTTLRDSFHGTAILLIQYPTTDVPGTVREINVIDGFPQQQR